MNNNSEIIERGQLSWLKTELVTSNDLNNSNMMQNFNQDSNNQGRLPIKSKYQGFIFSSKMPILTCATQRLRNFTSITKTWESSLSYSKQHENTK